MNNNSCMQGNTMTQIQNSQLEESQKDAKP